MSNSLKDILKISNLLFVDSDEELSKKSLDIFKLFFSKVVHCRNFKDAIKAYEDDGIDAIITDVILPDNCGINLIKKIREQNSKIPIAILSANKDEKYLFEAIRLNLVDYLVKPANANDLIFTLNNMAKKIFNNGNIQVNINGKITYSFLEKNLQNGNKKIPLTKNETKLLELLILNKDKTVSKEDIEYHIWEDGQISDSAFKSLFLRLRNKIGKETIKNNFGVGYSIDLKE